MHWQPTKLNNRTLHAQIVQWFTERIAAGDFPAGMKLPTQRALAAQFQVNRSTITAAFDELKAQGLLDTKVGAGTFVTTNPWQAMLPTAKWQQHINESIHKPNVDTIQLINEYETYAHVIRLGTGELAPHLLPTAALQHSLQHLTLDEKLLNYSEPKGSLALRKAICAHVKKRGIHTTPANILIVSGALQALQLTAFGLLQRGSVVFQPHASYLHSIHPFQSANMHMRTIDDIANAHHVPPHTESIYYAMPILSNPTGKTWDKEEREHVYTTCRTLSIPILEDDVYGELLFEQMQPPLKAMDDVGHILYVGSVSKTLSPGLRIGWMIGPEAIIERLADVKMQTDYGSSALSQQLVTHWLRSGLYDAHVATLTQELQQRAHFLHHLLHKHFAHIATWEKPTGGFYIWIRFSKPVVTKAFFLALLQQNVLINPGYIYMLHDFHHIRLSYSYASYDELTEGIEQLAKQVKIAYEASN